MTARVYSRHRGLKDRRWKDKEEMKARDLAAVGLKILAVYVFFQFLMMLPTGLGMFQMSHSFRDSGETETSGMRQYALLAS